MGHTSSKYGSYNSSNNNNNNNNNNGNDASSAVGFYDQTQLLPSADIDYYVIRLDAEQSVRLYGFMLAKTTLTWRDILQNEPITLSSCISCGITSSKLNRMQPDIKEWINHGKASLDDCEHMGPWLSYLLFLLAIAIF